MDSQLNVRFGPFEVTSADGQLRRDGVVVPLQELPFRLLLVLLRAPGVVVGRHELCHALWGDTIVEYEAGLNTAVRKLRDALGDDPAAPIYVETVPKRGYRFRVAVVAAPTMGAQDAPSSDSPARPALPAPAATAPAAVPVMVRARWQWVAALGTCAAMATWALWPADGASPPAVPRILVLPVVEPSAGSAQAGGLTDQLIAHLARLDPAHFMVLGPMTSRAASHGAMSQVVLARDLGVTHVLSATLSDGTDRRLAVTLTRTVDQAVVWSDVLVDEVAPPWPELSTRWITQVARGVLGALGLAASERALARASTLSHEAFDAYLSGRADWARFDAHGLAAGLQALETARALDPQFVDAHVGVAEAHGLLALLQLAPVQPSLVAAREAATAALRIESDNPAALAALAFAQFYTDQDPSATAQNFERALALDAGRALTHQWAAALYSSRANHERALALAQRAHELDPLSPTVNSDLCWYSYFARQHGAAAVRGEQAFTQFRRPGPLLCSQLAYWQLQDERRERGALIRRLNSAGRVADAQLLTAAFEAGGMRELRAADFRRLGASAVAADSYQRVVAAIALGDAPGAVRILTALAADRPPWFAFLSVDPAFDALRADAEFRALLSRPARTMSMHRPPATDDVTDGRPGR